VAVARVDPEERQGRNTITEVREGHSFDIGALEGYLRKHVPDYAGPLVRVSEFQGGQSNLTYLLATPSRAYVLRRRPAGHLLPGAHAVDREYRIMSTLGASTDVPVPHTYVFCADEDVIGTAFFVMEYVEGRIFWDSTLPELEVSERRAYVNSLVEVLARLHTVNYGAIGLADFGRQGSYVRRQIARWSKQYLSDPDAGRVASIDRLIEWLTCHVPETEETTLVHADLRFDNVVFHSNQPKVLAILDWELATLGDPLADLGYLLMTYHLPTVGISGLLGKDLVGLGIPSEADVVRQYCACSGRRDIPYLDFYVVFNLFRYAAVLHGIRGRVLRGTAASVRARDYAEHVETVADIGWAQIPRST
jgi:aminoglycoside phosphotransferase (APT) family kinase protein